MPGLQRLHLAVVVGAPDVDEVRPSPRSNLSRWYARSLQRYVVVPSDLHEHAVALVAEVGRCAATSRRPARRRRPRVARGRRAPRRPSPRSCSVRSENQVSKCTPMRPRSSLQLLDDVAVAPLARLLVGRRRRRARRACRSAISTRYCALVAVLGRLLALVAREQRRARTCRAGCRRRSGSTRGAPRRPAPRAGSRARRRPRPSARRRRAADRSGWPRRTRG